MKWKARWSFKDSFFLYLRITKDHLLRTFLRAAPNKESAAWNQSELGITAKEKITRLCCVWPDFLPKVWGQDYPPPPGAKAPHLLLGSLSRGMAEAPSPPEARVKARGRGATHLTAAKGRTARGRPGDSSAVFRQVNADTNWHTWGRMQPHKDPYAQAFKCTGSDF